MDFNRKYADHQKAVMRASAATDEDLREEHLEDAADIAEEIGDQQRKLGAAASGTWNETTPEAAEKPGSDAEARAR